MDRLIAINKPKGPTSHDMVSRLRRQTGERRIGHAGTLDPLASGVLVMGIGREATKQLGSAVKKEKEYVATLRLGEVSASEDAEKVIKNDWQFFAGRWALIINFRQGIFYFGLIPNRARIGSIIKRYVGKIEQIPPVASAIKINGRRAYKSFRSGQAVKMPPRQVEIKEIELLDYAWPSLKIRVVCGAGTYIRSLARDIGSNLRCGAYLSDLVRTRVGEYRLGDCVNIDDIKYG